MAKGSTNSNSALVQMQKLANQTQVTLQNMVNSSNKLQMEYNKQEAQAARDWQTNMSKTAHQMEVEDLKKAGLNPVLSSGGSGAQSYTTSSASTQNDSGASALAGVQSAQLGAIGSMESSRIQAAAQKAAAAQSAAAMRAAAAASAAATKYAADKNLEGIVVRAAADKWIATNKQAGGLFGFLDKLTSKSGIQDGAIKSVKSVGKKFKSQFDSMLNNPGKFFSNSGKITANNFKLNDSGVKSFNKITKALGLKPTAANRSLVCRAYVFHDFSALRSLGSRVNTVYNSNPHHAAKVPARSGHR